MTPHVAHIPESLEFDAILQEVATFAASDLGRDVVLGLVPSRDYEPARLAMRRVFELTGLLMRSVDIPMAGISDVGPALAAAALEGALIDPESLFRIGQFAEACERLETFFDNHRSACPTCWEMTAGLQGAPETRRAVLQAIGPGGLVLDDASPELRRLRRMLRDMEGKIGANLQNMVNRLSQDGALADAFYTQRNGRYVLPLRAGARGKVQGIVHDASNSGQTLFIEPLSVVELSNEMTALQCAEAEEVRRILMALCDIVRAESPILTRNLTIVRDLDALYARARFGVRVGCAIPRLIESGPLDLRQAHHPFLFIHQRKTSIPIQVRLEEKDRTLLISGPNAGGKTTALKTIGLLCAMAQCAIPVPAAPNSTLPVFSAFFADIGDDQNVASGLSTFSAHIRRLRDILEAADRRSLVLLDELGTATDPLEGGCLAVAIAERLCAQAALTVITSHLAVLKNWAHEESTARNCSFRLDDQTRQPSFVLTMDVPGASQALIVAEQQGMDAALIHRAREILPPGQEDISSLIMSLQRKNEELDRMRNDQAQALTRLEADRQRYEDLYGQYMEERKAFRQDTLAEKKRLLDATRGELESRIAHLPGKDALLRAKADIQREQQTVADEIRRLTEPPPPPEDTARLKEGSLVSIDGMTTPGRIVQFARNRSRAWVQVSGLSMEFPVTRLRPADDATRKSVKEKEKENRRKTRGGGVRVVKRSDAGISLELDLLGQYVEDAVEMTDQYLSDAALHHADRVRLLHGAGTGRLRKGLHAFLKTHPLVKRFRYGLPDEGGAGVTVVELRD